jgi:hypothetical protein
VRLLKLARVPTSSLPLPAVAYGEVPRTCRVCAAVPLLVIARLVTATFCSVMNLFWVTERDPLVWTLRQWLGVCRRWLTCSAKLPGVIATV